MNDELSHLDPKVKSWAIEAIQDHIDEDPYGFEFAGSFRAACVDDPDFGSHFEDIRSCCGCEEWDATGPDGKTYSLGFNYVAD